MTIKLLLAVAALSIGTGCVTDEGGTDVIDITPAQGKADGAFHSTFTLTEQHPDVDLGFQCNELIHCRAVITIVPGGVGERAIPDGEPVVSAEVTRLSDGGSALFQMTERTDADGLNRIYWTTARPHRDLVVDSNNYLVVSSWRGSESFTIHLDHDTWDVRDSVKFSVSARWQ